MRTSWIALLLCLVLAPPVAVATQTAEPSTELPIVQLIATGGTISSRPASRLTAEDLVALVPTLDSYVQAEAEQFSNLPSSDLAVMGWLALARRINELFDERSDLAGVVVSSGTDTLEETAYFLHLTVRHTRPVVVVGSMRPPTSLGYDGTANLLQAFRVAAEPSSRNLGVLVVLNAEINSAREATKTHAQRLHTFETRGYGILGVADPDRVIYYRRPDRRHTVLTEFDVSDIERLPKVDVLLSYQDAPGDLILAAVERGATGLVIAASGAGSMSPSQRDAVKRVVDQGVPIVITSRTGGGRIAALPRPSSDAQEPSNNYLSPRQISGEDLSPIKARILLMLALTQTRDEHEIQRMFKEY